VRTASRLSGYKVKTLRISFTVACSTRIASDSAASNSALLQKLCKLWGQQILHNHAFFSRTTCCLTHQKQTAAKEYGGSLLLKHTTSCITSGCSHPLITARGMSGALYCKHDATPKLLHPCLPNSPVSSCVRPCARPPLAHPKPRCGRSLGNLQPLPAQQICPV
jgi:hypothetical protein